MTQIVVKVVEGRATQDAQSHVSLLVLTNVYHLAPSRAIHLLLEELYSTEKAHDLWRYK